MIFFFFPFLFLFFFFSFQGGLQARFPTETFVSFHKVTNKYINEKNSEQILHVNIKVFQRQWSTISRDFLSFHILTVDVFIQAY